MSVKRKKQVDDSYHDEEEEETNTPNRKRVYKLIFHYFFMFILSRLEDQVSLPLILFQNLNLIQSRSRCLFMEQTILMFVKKYFLTNQKWIGKLFRNW